jgi:hypothetical protein
MSSVLTNACLHPLAVHLHHKNIASARPAILIKISMLSASENKFNSFMYRSGVRLQRSLAL